MSDVKEVILRDVRCFEGAHRGRLRPITLLVGENSTGKSTFLGCYSVLYRVLSGMGFHARLDFNEVPFLLGAFRDIVRSKRGRGNLIDQFQVGFVLAPSGGDEGVSHEFLTTFAERDSLAVPSSFVWRFGDEAFLELKRGSDDEIVARVPNHRAKINLPFESATYVLNVLVDIDYIVRGNPDLQPIIDYLDKLLPARRADASRPQRLSDLVLNLPDLVPIAPLRAKPKRTYDPVDETASPDGGHVPMLMMQLDHTAKRRWGALHDDLVEFGRTSGLFSDLKVKRHGKQASDPFQLQVKARSGSYANIMDVGYGVSQVLPILVDLMAADEFGRRSAAFRLRKSGRVYVLQQPEVHLHPRGQSELASLFVESFARRGNHFLVETHSEHIVDRVRISVRKGILTGDDVSILYFESKGSAVKIHNMTLDKEGNLNGAPPGYRDFFARESDRLLGFPD